MTEKDLRVTLSGLTLDNPVIPASGTFGYGREFWDLYDLDILGSISFKGTTTDPRYGNPLPRIAETPSGMLNAVGLQNPGVYEVVKTELPSLREHFHKPLIANISGFSIQEYERLAEVMDAQPQIGILEVNISCPNVHGGGMSFGADPALAAQVTAAVRKKTSLPVYVKLTPNVTDIAGIAAACEDAGADGIALINTLLAMRLDLKTRRPLLANTTGGLSGPAVFPVALRMVWQCFERVHIPIIGMGGISTPEDVLEMMMAGAAAVEVGAANLRDPFVCKIIIDELPAAMERYHIDRLADIVGCAHGKGDAHA